MKERSSMNLMRNNSRSLNNSLDNRGIENRVSNWESKRGYEGSSWEMKTSIEKELRIGISLTLVKTVDRLVAVARERASIARCKVWSVCIGVCVWGIVVQRIGFRLSQAERGYGENYDLKKKSIDQDLQASQLGMLTMHFMMCTGLLS